MEIINRHFGHSNSSNPGETLESRWNPETKSYQWYDVESDTFLSDDDATFFF